MTQAQPKAHSQMTNTFFVDLEGLSIKVWKKGREGMWVTLCKPNTSQCLTLPLHVFHTLLEAQDVLLLAADFVQGLIGYSPLNLVDDV